MALTYLNVGSFQQIRMRVISFVLCQDVVFDKANPQEFDARNILAAINLPFFPVAAELDTFTILQFEPDECDRAVEVIVEAVDPDNHVVDMSISNTFAPARADCRPATSFAIHDIRPAHSPVSEQ